MIKNIVFDIGGVIWKGNHSIIFEKTDLNDKEKEELEEKYFKPWLKVDLGEETVVERFSSCTFSFKIDEKTKDKLIHFYKYREFNEEIIKLMHELKDNDYNIYILSNNNKESIKYLKSLNKLNFLNGWILSCDVHEMKPGKEIYEILFDKYNLKPSECYFIDDKGKNIKEGKNLGMYGFVFKDDIHELINDMKGKGINVR